MGLKKLLKKGLQLGGAALGGAIGGPVGAKIGGTLGSVAGGLIGSSGAKKAGKAAASGYEASAAEQRAALDSARTYQSPYLHTGQEGVNALIRTNSGDFSDFENSPDYVYARDQALRGVERSAAARGGLFGGNTGVELARHASGLASQNLGNYRNALMGQIGIGERAAGTMTNATLNNAAGVGNALAEAGNARASGIVGKTNAITGAIEDISGLAGDYLGNNLIKRKPAAKPAGKINPRSTVVPY